MFKMWTFCVRSRKTYCCWEGEFFQLSKYLHTTWPKYRVFFVRKVYKVNDLFKVEIIYYPVRNLILGYLPIIDLEKKKSAPWQSEYGTIYVVTQCSNNWKVVQLLRVVIPCTVRPKYSKLHFLANFKSLCELN